MTTNEVAENMRKVYLDFAPASIEITNYDELKAEVDKFAAKYTGIAFGRDEKQDAELIRGRLIELHDALEEERKEVKKIYNGPLKKFEEKVKELTSTINVPLDEIRKGLKEIETHEKEERRLQLISLLEAKSEEVGLSVEEIEIAPAWLNKSSFTAKMNLTAKVNGEIDKAISDILAEKKRKEIEIKILTEFCNAQGIEPAGWISQLEHRNAMEVIDLINLERERQKKLDEELSQKKKEHDEFIARQQQTIDEAEAFAEKQKEVQQVISKPAVIYSAALKIYGTEEQLNELNDFLISRNMRVEEIQEDVEENHDKIQEWADDFPIDDLPF